MDASTDNRALAGAIRECAQLSGTFVLRSGTLSDTYFDKYQFEADPHLLARIAEALEALIPAGTEVLAGLELGGVPLATALSLRTGLPAAFIRKEAKTYGTCRYAEGASLVGKRFVLIEDAVSSGGAILDALRKLRADGLEPTAALCVIDRQSGGKEALAAADLPLLSVFERSDIETST